MTIEFREIRILLSVTALNFVAYLTIAMILISTQLGGIIVSSIPGVDREITFINILVDQFNSAVETIRTNEALSLILLFVVVAGVGYVLFSLVNLLLKAVFEIKERFEQTIFYLHPDDFNLGKYWLEFFINILAHFLIIGTFILYSYIWYKSVLPAFRYKAEQLSNFASIDWLDFSISLAVLFLSLHIFVLFKRLYGIRYY